MYLALIKLMKNSTLQTHAILQINLTSMLKTFFLLDFTINFLHNANFENLKQHPKLMVFLYSHYTAGLACSINFHVKRNFD